MIDIAQGGDVGQVGLVEETDLVAAAELDPSADDETDDPVQGELFLGADADLPAETVPAGDVSRAHLKGLIEALVFVSDRPVSLNELAKVAGRANRKLMRALVEELRAEYARRGIHLEEVAGGLIFRTNPSYGPFIRDVAAKKPVKMTRAQLEALAIIAYRQPLTRPDVDEIRGVDSGPVMKMLLDRDLIKILGKKDEPGRPLLYGTTPVFLEFFGLKSLKDLPSLREFTDLSEDSRRVYQREMVEAGEDPSLPPSVESLASAASTVGSAADPEVSIDEPQPTIRSEELDGAETPGLFEQRTDPSMTFAEGIEGAGSGASEAENESGEDLDEAEVARVGRSRGG